MTISGSGFTGATAVSFGDVAAEFTIGSDREIVAVAPARRHRRRARAGDDAGRHQPRHRRRPLHLYVMRSIGAWRGRLAPGDYTRRYSR